jgi:hypothetical protein
MSGSPSIGVLFDRDSLRVPELIAVASTGMRKAADARGAVISPAFWVTSAQRVVDLVEKLVDVPLADILVGAWKVNRQFSKYTNPAAYPPEKVTCVELLTHHIKSSYEPYLELVIDGQPSGKLEFCLAMDVAFKAGVLTIQAGKFRRLDPGRCDVTGTLSCGGVEITQRKSDEFRWDQGITFDPGVAIATAM